VTLEDLHEELWAALESLAGPKLTAYDGEVPATPDTNYAVLWMSPGFAMSTRVGFAYTDRSNRFQITVASSNGMRACAATGDLVIAKFSGLKLGDPSDPNAPRCKEDATPGPIAPDTKVPGDTRWWMPIPYRVVTSI
jgi:hypothetical protein